MAYELPDAGLVDALRKLLAEVGPDRALVALVLVSVGLSVRRLYLDWRERLKTNEALAEKERTIQRLATQERQWRKFFLMKIADLSVQEADRLVDQNDWSTAVDARQALEGRKQPRKGKGKSRED